MIVIVDFGSQTCHLIGRRLKDIGITTRIVEPEFAIKEIKKQKTKGVVLSGGPASVFEKGAPTIDKKIYQLGIPILGICYGWQLTAHLFGGKVVPGHREYGPGNLEIEISEPLFSNIESYSKVWLSHGTSVTKLPKGYQSLARTGNLQYAASANFEKNIFGLQFHPEVEHTIYGSEILKNFAVNICHIKPVKKTLDVGLIIKKIKKDVGNGSVICAVSGGVDSTVAAVLVGKAVGKKLHPVYVESGLMREGTAKEVQIIFRKHVGVTPIIVDARKEFITRLRGAIDAESKRKIIGALYIEQFEKVQKKLKGITHLMQGTIYSDVIESKGTKNADKIKSHHNVGGLPANLKLKLIEPLRTFYKDEVRAIGKQLKLPDEIVYKQVFPGPGQAIRIVGEVTPERLKRQHMADNVVIEEMKKSGFYKKVYMSFSIMTNTVSTAVKGDSRELLEVVALRVIESKDVMTTNWARLPYDLLQTISSRIVNEVPGVSRVVYDITTKPPATMEWE